MQGLGSKGVSKEKAYINRVSPKLLWCICPLQITFPKTHNSSFTE